MGQICIIIREDCGKLLVIFWLGCLLSCEMLCKVAVLKERKENFCGIWLYKEGREIIIVMVRFLFADFLVPL